jgi:hypothetical protein
MINNAQCCRFIGFPPIRSFCVWAGGYPKRGRVASAVMSQANVARVRVAKAGAECEPCSSVTAFAPAGRQRRRASSTQLSDRVAASWLTLASPNFARKVRS